MSSICHKISKNIETQKLVFPVDMYSSLFGSAAICVYVLGGCKADISQVRKIWCALKKKKVQPETLPYLDDEKFISKCASYFKIAGYTDDMISHICFVTSDYGPQFTLLSGTSDVPLPLREDGFIGRILSTGKIYPLKNSTTQEALS